ncbi:MAG TPA: dTDP-glucose 4,6-dehydratase [Marinilabiliales bacterium]|nr:dTDP-glucose 4,6-dehydratase [Marinilabiliales bacterium]
MRLLITGGSGFMGSNFVRYLYNAYQTARIWNLDLLTYAGNPENLADIEAIEAKIPDHERRYTFIKGDVADRKLIQRLFEENNFDTVFNFAAESHVDRSITDPMAFINTNVLGTVHLLNAAKEQWKGNFEGKRFYHISTDEVYGALGDTGFFTEETSYDPKSPYSASKASSDHFVRAYKNTYKLPIVVSNCSNNYGPNQFPEKLLPLAINNIKNKKPIPIYGKGENIRDWLYVEDHASAIDLIYHKAANGKTYNIGGHNEWTNIALIKLLCKVMDKKLGCEAGESEKLITYVTDRAGHDLRYAIDASLIEKELGWKPSLTFEIGLEKTVDWYLDHQEWMDRIVSGAYTDYYTKMYHNR